MRCSACGQDQSSVGDDVSIRVDVNQAWSESQLLMVWLHYKKPVLI
ncbi:hypothetical protein I633_21766 (plasmid) [Alteromonas mediterranea 615]|uniref:Uncharacterized protein n=1 Tax=Alteromonas mediterranea 615 TaxID=1300253 RepID=S5ASF3_9ALTE|nr:hypothetical protein I633_21766 [Alteromonas mediterranea 615]